MAGSDQSANLGGMLSQIGGVLGRGVDVGGLGANIVNMGRPDVDPTDIKGMMQLQNWQQKVGREDAARTTMAGVGQLRAAQEKQAALDKAAKVQQGQTALAQINQGMQALHSNPNIAEEVKAERMAALQLRANETATTYGLNPLSTMNMAADAVQQANALEAQQVNLSAAKRANQRQAATSMLSQAEAKGPEAYEAAVLAVTENGFGDVARTYGQTKLTYDTQVEAYNEVVKSNAPLTEDDRALAADVGMTPAQIASYDSLMPNVLRADVRRLGLEKAGRERQEAGAKPMEYGVVKDLVPAILSDLQSEGGQFWDWLDQDLEDIASNILEDEAKLDGLAAKVKASGATNPEEARAILLEELRKQDTSWFGRENAVDEFLGTETRTVNGKTATITEVSD